MRDPEILSKATKMNAIIHVSSALLMGFEAIAYAILKTNSIDTGAFFSTGGIQTLSALILFFLAPILYLLTLFYFIYVGACYLNKFFKSGKKEK